jgi:hypothetical protein
MGVAVVLVLFVIGRGMGVPLKLAPTSFTLLPDLCLTKMLQGVGLSPRKGGCLFSGYLILSDITGSLSDTG